MVNVRPAAAPDESVTADPVCAPLPSVRTTFVSDTALPSAVSVMSSKRILFITPAPVTSTVVVSTVPSMKSTVPLPEITTSLVFEKSLSVSVIVPVPAWSIPTALVPRSIDS